MPKKIIAAASARRVKRNRRLDATTRRIIGGSFPHVAPGMVLAVDGGGAARIVNTAEPHTFQAGRDTRSDQLVSVRLCSWAPYSSAAPTLDHRRCRLWPLCEGGSVPIYALTYRVPDERQGPDSYTPR